MDDIDLSAGKVSVVHNVMKPCCWQFSAETAFIPAHDVMIDAIKERSLRLLRLCY